MARTAANLKGWTNEPEVQDAVIEVLSRGDMPLLMSEVASECGIPIHRASRVLLRLTERGRCTRYKLPIHRHGYNRTTKACVANAARRMLFVYSWVA